MEGFAVACQLAPTVPHLVSGSCPLLRTFVPRFLQTPPRGDALALPLSFGLRTHGQETFTPKHDSMHGTRAQAWSRRGKPRGSMRGLGISKYLHLPDKGSDIWTRSSSIPEIAAVAIPLVVRYLLRRIAAEPTKDERKDMIPRQLESAW
jgi:hypothetical protein